jgi:hypothetical protein
VVVSVSTVFTLIYLSFGSTILSGFDWIYAYCVFLATWSRHTMSDGDALRNPWQVCTTAYSLMFLMVSDRDLADTIAGPSSLPEVERARRLALRLNRLLLAAFCVTGALILGLMLSVVLTGGPR